MSLFDEILTCESCPNVDVIADNNQAEVDAHLQSHHKGVSVNAFIVSKRPKERQWLDDTYDEAKDYLDTYFPSKFLLDLDQCAWELCTYRYLVDNGITIYQPERAAGPDFNTSIGYVECISLKRGNKENAIPYSKPSVLRADGTFDKPIEFKEVPTNAIKLRVSSGFAEKQRKYEGYAAQDWFDVSKPRIIALNWGCEGTVWASDGRNIATNPALQTLFGTGPIEIVIDSKNRKVVDERLSKVPVLKKVNESLVDVGFFAKPPETESQRIDGVIMSSKWPISYVPDTYRIVSNPFTDGMDMESFSIGHKTSTELSDDKKYISIQTLI